MRGGRSIIGGGLERASGVESLQGEKEYGFQSNLMIQNIVREKNVKFFFLRTVGLSFKLCLSFALL